MIDLTNIEEINKIDPLKSYESTELLIKQFQTSWDEVNKLEISKRFENISNIVCCGMGASIYGAIVIKSILGRNLPYPVEMVSDYYLPDYVGKNTLVVLTSYSGTTEEVLSCAQDAKAKEANMIVLTEGGPLAEFAKNNDLPAYIFDGKLNPSECPRLGCGYTTLGLIGLLNKTGVIDLEEHEVSNAITRLHEKFTDLKQLALSDHKLFMNDIPIIFAAEHLGGNAQILRNQINETGKTFSSFFMIPDLNHHLMEGLQFPENSSLHFIILNSANYSEKIRKRIELTIDVLRQNNHPVHEFMTSGQTLYDDFLETAVYGSFLSLYMGLAHEQNPAANPWVDYFKKKLNGDNK